LWIDKTLVLELVGGIIMIAACNDVDAAEKIERNN
jgi:hypothetical protein